MDGRGAKLAEVGLSTAPGDGESGRGQDDRASADPDRFTPYT